MRDEIPGIATVAVISDGLWRRGFGADPNVLGRKLRIDEDVYEIIGVMPPSFRHPTQTSRPTSTCGRRAAGVTRRSRSSYSARFMPSAIGRLAWTDLDEARARIENLSQAMIQEHPDQYPARLGWTPRSIRSRPISSRRFVRPCSC